MPTNKKITFIVIAVALAIMAVVYFVFDPTTTRLFPKCAFYALTGFKCPGCGSQRAIHALLHADVLAAIRYNALLVFSLPFIALLLTNRYCPAHSHAAVAGDVEDRECAEQDPEDGCPDFECLVGETPYEESVEDIADVFEEE